MTTTGAIELSYAIIEQAVSDCKLMMRRGLLSADGTAAQNKSWPKRTAATPCGANVQNRLYNHIGKPYEIEQLVAWLACDGGKLPLNMLLSECGSKLQARDICVGVGLDYDGINERMER